MSQKIITSFFKAQPITRNNTSSDISVDDRSSKKEKDNEQVKKEATIVSPVKCNGSSAKVATEEDSPPKVTMTRKKRTIDSDSEEEVLRPSSSDKLPLRKTARVDRMLPHTKLLPGIAKILNEKPAKTSKNDVQVEINEKTEELVEGAGVKGSEEVDEENLSELKPTDLDEAEDNGGFLDQKSIKVTKESEEPDKQLKNVKEESGNESMDQDKAVSSEEELPVRTTNIFFAPRKGKANPKQKKPKKEKLRTMSAEKLKDAGGGSGNAEVDYMPSKSSYHPIDSAYWARGDKVPYLALARTLEAVEEVSARLKMIEILSNFLRSVIVLSPDDLLPSVYLCLNKLAPANDGLELGVAETTLMKTIAQSTGRSVAQIKSDAATVGDLGIVAEQSRSNQRTMFQPAKLTVHAVFNKLKEIAQMSGAASMSKKVNTIQAMFVACRHSEARYLIRSLAGKLRIGLAEQSVLQALALACALTPPEQPYPPKVLNASKTMSAEAFKTRFEEEALIIKTTFSECPNFDKIMPVLLREGVRALPQHCQLAPGIPLKPMLAHPTKGVSEVLKRFEGLKFTCEWKYDGERAQIHLAEGGTVSIFSRNQEDNTSKYPDIVARLPKVASEHVRSCVLDCEAVAWDRTKKQILPFQVLSTRKRKDAKEEDIKVQVCVFMFDLLYLNGEALVRKPLAERRSLLQEHFAPSEGEFQLATSLDTTTMEEVQDFLEESIRGNCEGLMVKTLEQEATYEIAKRSRNWLKLKKDYLDGVGDTLDLVVVGGYLGRGKRVGTYGGFLLACYDKENEEYQSICKIGTGFSDEILQTHSDFFKKHVIPQARSYYRYDTSHEPDHWFDAVQVWEIKCADLSLSPVHRAAIGIVDSEKGISLRFPRFLRIRDDKAMEDATSANQVADFYESQEQIKNQQGGGSKATETDFY